MTGNNVFCDNNCDKDCKMNKVNSVTSWIFLPLLLLLCVNPLPVLAQIEKTKATAFVNVNVLPMDTRNLLRDYTVVVEGEEITTVGPSADVEVPSGAFVIAASGAYLMPGLADMHTHLSIDSNPDFMRLFLAEGVTTIRNLNGLPDHLEWREQVLHGDRIGPTIYTSGPVIAGPPDPSIVWIFRLLVIAGLLALGATLLVLHWLLQRLRGSNHDIRPSRRAILPGAIILLVLGIALLMTNAIPINVYTSLQFPIAYVPDTVTRARAEVRRQVMAGYDLIKVYDYLTRDQYLAVIDEAQIQGIYIVGHLDHGIEAPFATGLRESAHVDEFLDEHLMGEMSPRAFRPLPMNLELIPRSVASAVDHDVMVVSNMVMDEVTYEYLEAGPAYFERPEYDRIRRVKIQEWLAGRMVSWQGQQDWRRQTLQPFYEQMIRELHAAGVPILTGTDTGEQGALPEHIHRDLELLVVAGLSPYEALKAATRNARLSVNRMGVGDAFGEVLVGQRADLILLESNPLEDVSATRQRLGVMSRGRWYPLDELNRLVEEVVSSYQDP
jgi:imidazolonepropionase-like amidohydrolase